MGTSTHRTLLSFRNAAQNYEVSLPRKDGADRRSLYLSVANHQTTVYEQACNGNTSHRARNRYKELLLHRRQSIFSLGFGWSYLHGLCILV